MNALIKTALLAAVGQIVWSAAHARSVTVLAGAAAVFCLVKSLQPNHKP